jgi:hypothetical protein
MNLGIILNFSTQMVEWDEMEIPMKPESAPPERAFYIKDSNAVDSATERIKHILEAKYEAADLNKLVSACNHLLFPQHNSSHNF